MTIANDQPVAVGVELARTSRDIGVHLGLKGDGEHPARTFPTDLVDPEGEFHALGLIRDYFQHRRSFLPRRRSIAERFLRILQRGRYAAPRLRWVIHRFWL
jgi:hypothetical protein